MNESKIQINEVATALRSFIERIDTMLKMIGGKTSITNTEKEDLRSMARLLKKDINDAAKRGTVNITSSPPNFYEDNFFEPAVRKAKANFLVKTSSHPIKSNWFHHLYGVRIDFSHELAELEGSQANKK